MDRLGEMLTFVRVVEVEGFSAAGRELNLTPSAVSKLIRRLEDRLSTRLLNRTTRQLSLTEEGHAYYERCVHILGEISEAEQMVNQLHGVPSGTLKVNAAVAFGIYQIVPLVPEFMDRYPLVRLHFTVMDRVVDLVHEGVDLAIRSGVLDDSGLVSRLLAEDQRLIAASPAYIRRRGIPETPGDLVAHNCLAWASNATHLNDWPFQGPDGPYTVRAKGNTEVNNGEALYEMAVAGLGVARMAEFRVGEAVKAGRLVPLLAEHQRADPLPIYAVYPHRQHLSPKVRAFVDFLVEKFTPTPPWKVAN